MIRKVDSELIGKVLGSYIPGMRYLVSAGVEYSEESKKICRAEGKFALEGSEYLIGVPHLTTIQALACVNQLSFVAFAQLIYDKKIQGLEALPASIFLENKGNVIIPRGRFGFEGVIDPAKEVFGRVDINSIKKINSSYVSKVEYYLGNDEGNYLFNGKLLFVLPHVS